ncbi:DUF262 domain-containing protein [Haloterrigena alkaliphila]|uniref:DUF262 domain-containing protein n=1 Tax=Haloterrigena alkaliphila TaxID=2816475 RepID=A0A8A2VSJ0_9EURY|nr:DUF262 domain-containing protein [Haloterrigena alkaliphila]QSX00999.1 DUF262 domain-containing protein [Haloterrigena alkaliphila]
MGFQSTTIAKVVPKLNESIFVPAIQREFVWGPDQVKQLFDSILREYPIGSFLFWEVNGEQVEQQIKYRFVQNYVERSIVQSEFSDAHHHNPKLQDGFGLPNELTLVLDGQQRLTALYIGLTGTYIVKKPYFPNAERDSYERKRLYLNLLSDPNQVSNDELKMRYDFQFKAGNVEQSTENYWYWVGDILEAENLMDAMAIKDAPELEELPPEKESYLQNNIMALYNTIHNNDIINFYPEDTSDNERVLDIFLRTNEGGTQLSKSEILLSMATAQWTSDTSDPLDAREAITSFVDEINHTYSDADFGLGIDFVLKTLLVLSDISAEYRIANFTDENLAAIRRTWEEGDFEPAVRRALNFLVEVGIDGRSLTSDNAIIPLIYFFHANTNPDVQWTSIEGRQTRKRIYFWLTSALLNSAFTTRPDQVLDRSRKAIADAPADEFPLSQIHREMNSLGKVVGFDEEVVQGLLDSTSYTRQKIYLFLSLIYFPNTLNENIEYEVDHIFNRDRLDETDLRVDHGLDAETARRCEELKDRPGNLQLLGQDEHFDKGEKTIAEWLSERTDEYRERHLIPEDETLHTLEKFPDFVEQREQLIKEHIVDTFRNTSREGPEQSVSPPAE